MVSATLSPFDAEEELAEEKPRTAKIHHGSFKAETGACAWFIK